MSAGIFVVLALGWAGYLIPRALKHHDEVARTRSIDRFSHTMRVLARREPARAAAPAPTRPARMAPRASAQARRKAAAAAARRRRRVLILLLLANAVVGGLVVADILLRWAVAIPAAVTLLYLALCRTLVKREWAREVAAARAALEPEPEQFEQPSVRLRSPQGFEEVSPNEDTTTIDVAAVVAAVPTSDGGSLWDPLPVTLPTYVGKPMVARTVRTIDLTDPEIASSGRDAADSQLVAQAEAPAPAGDEDVSAQQAV